MQYGVQSHEVLALRCIPPLMCRAEHVVWVHCSDAVHRCHSDPAVESISSSLLILNRTRAQVRYLTTPSMRELLPMWGRAFGFVALSVGEWQALENRCSGMCLCCVVGFVY